LASAAAPGGYNPEEPHTVILSLIHTSPVLIPTFAQLCGQHLPGVEVFHIVDESLIKNTIKAGHLEPLTVRRLAGYVQSAREAGAAAVLVTCSSIGPATTAIKPLFDFPVLRIDEAMAEKAVEEGRRIGVLATLRTTLDPTVELVRSTAAAANKSVEIRSRLCDGAFEAILAGNSDEHDRRVREGLQELLEESDVIVLAQASMARVINQLPEALRQKPILTSPELAIRRTNEVLSTALHAAS
jgi:Asp/Glu/hydantoin racemase